jgi:acylphosphatase
MRRVDLRVRGLVQGVFFRVSTQRKARELGVRGTVRNEPDGTVFIEAEGGDKAVTAFVAWCRKGPPAARVDRVDAFEGEPAGFAGFEIT